MTGNATIWLVRKTSYDISSAREHGTVVQLFDDNVSPMDVNRQQEILQDRVREMSPTDYLLMVGPCIMLSVCAAFINEAFGEVKMLVFNPRVGGGKYVPKYYRSTGTPASDK